MDAGSSGCAARDSGGSTVLGVWTFSGPSWVSLWLVVVRGCCVMCIVIATVCEGIVCVGNLCCGYVLLLVLIKAVRSRAMYGAWNCSQLLKRSHLSCAAHHNISTVLLYIDFV